MSDITNLSFIKSFNNGMLYEVGPWWDSTDSEVISGACDTTKQKRKVGYCNVVGDSGGLTKYGIAKNYNKSVDVQNLNLEKTKQVYFDSYWVPSHCPLITTNIHMFYFDMVINNGPTRAAKILQQAIGVDVDGMIGEHTLSVINNSNNVVGVINTMSELREQRYRGIVANDASQSKFLDGWLNRNKQVTKASIAALNT